MIDDPVSVMLEKAIYGSALRHRAIVSNLSNVNTPNYKRVDVDFKTSLENARKSLENGDKSKAIEELENFSPDIISDGSTSIRLDGNNVDIDREMSLLAENTLEYNTYITLISKRFNMLKNVINEGKK